MGKSGFINIWPFSIELETSLASNYLENLFYVVNGTFILSAVI